MSSCYIKTHQRSLKKSGCWLNFYDQHPDFYYLCHKITNYYANMKKIVLLFMALAGAMTVLADNTYTYLTFETTDGAKASVSVESLKLTISGNTLTADSQTFILSNLSRMYFSMTDETVSGIEEITSTTLDEAADIYDLQGHKVSKEQMKKGIYIVKTKNKTYKMIVK